MVFCEGLVVEDFGEIFEGDGFVFVGGGGEAEGLAVPDCDYLGALGVGCCG